MAVPDPQGDQGVTDPGASVVLPPHTAGATPSVADLTPWADQYERDFGLVCVYCKKPADGTRHDVYGEHVLGGTLIVCADCDEDFQHEDGPWNEIR